MATIAGGRKPHQPPLFQWLTTDRHGANNWLLLHCRQICWTHIQRDFTAIAERSGVSAPVGQRLLGLKRQLFHQSHRWREGQIRETTLRAVSDLGVATGKKTHWATTVRTCRQILNVAPALWSVPGHPDVKPANNAAEDDVFPVGAWALTPAVIHHKWSDGVLSQMSALCLSRRLTVTTTLKLQERDGMALLVEAGEAMGKGLPASSLCPQRD